MHVQSHESALLTDIFVVMELLIIVCSLTEFRQTMFPINVQLPVSIVAIRSMQLQSP